MRGVEYTLRISGAMERTNSRVCLLFLCFGLGKESSGWYPSTVENWAVYLQKLRTMRIYWRISVSMPTVELQIVFKLHWTRLAYSLIWSSTVTLFLYRQTVRCQWRYLIVHLPAYDRPGWRGPGKRDKFPLDNRIPRSNRPCGGRSKSDSKFSCYRIYGQKFWSHLDAEPTEGGRAPFSKIDKLAWGNGWWWPILNPLHELSSRWSRYLHSRTGASLYNATASSGGQIVRWLLEYRPSVFSHHQS